MYLSFIHPIISIILFTSFYQFIYSDNTKLISKNSNDTRNSSFNLIIRMIAIGIQRPDDDKDSNKALDSAGDEQTEELQQNTRLLLLPLMIRILFERLATQQSKDVQKSYEINYKINTNKQNIVYESIQRFITITIDINKIEKITIIVFLILTFAILLFSIFSIIRRLRDTHINNHEETKKLLS